MSGRCGGVGRSRSFPALETPWSSQWLSIFNQHASDFIVGRPYYLKMVQLKYMENVGCAQEDREQMHRNIVSLAQSLQNFMIGYILDLWLCFLLFYIGSSLNGTREKRVPVHFSNISRHYLNVVWQLLSPYLYTIVFIYYAFCLVLMMLLRPLLVKKIACGLGKSDRFKSIYAALYFFPILTVLQAVGGGLLYYAFPYIILVLSLVTLAVYMSASEIENCYDLLVRKKRLIVLFSHWLLHAYGIISISRVDKLEQDLPLLALVPTPALFYLFTAKFTEPSRILSEGANGH
ncbi:JNK1/MAPK8-associated membrane protein isoform X5 [Dasypus novemcinctus]|uniref:JNK1/MAPK8-associated membrane protein isoform X5 n=1 Tax=Dasypus novemcinctus TaxID=9361 RepID=UPI0026603BF3|nr:JNK1/MAPK8-associated membrane protein isoform X5 [Dasypus novemcinctus]